MKRWLKNLISIILIVLFASGIVYMTLSSKETNNQGPMNGNIQNAETPNDNQTGGEIPNKPNENESGLHLYKTRNSEKHSLLAKP